VEGIGESFIGSLAGCRVDTDIVLEVDPGRESGVEFLEGLEPRALGFALEIILDGFVERFDLPLAVGLVGLVVELGGPELGEDPGELLGDVDGSVVQVMPNSA
jgi:hypothetical protein